MGITRPKRFALFAVLCGCGSPSDLSIGTQSDTSVASASSWRLLWHDDFDQLDPARWEGTAHTFDENYADFETANATTNGGVLDLRVQAKTSPFTGKPWSAAEVRTWQEFTYGKFLTSARFANASGVVSTLFSFYDWFALEPNSENWNEIVVESSGTSRLYYTYTFHDADAANGRNRVTSPSDMPFDITAAFHVYGYEWTPTSVTFTVDGAAVLTLDADIARTLTSAKRLVVSAYPSNRIELEGPFDPQALPVDALYDWAEVYEYVGPRDASGPDASMSATRDAPAD
jgi:beta-glucanase (GH16 family)